MKKGIWLSLFLFTSGWALAQHSPRPNDILFQTETVRSINLNYPVNKDIFGENRMLSKILVEAALSGKLVAYRDESFEDTLSVAELQEKMLISRDEDGFESYINPEELYLIELGEALIFDKNRSEHYFNMKFLTVIIPLGVNQRGLQEALCSFRYEDCRDLFKQDERAVSSKPLTGGRKIPYDALFVLKCFQAEFVRIGHGRVYFDQEYNDKIDIFLATKAAEERLINYLWRLYNPK